MSDKVEIPDEAVGAAARAYYENLGWDWDDLGGWHEDKQRELDHEESKATILREFRAALEAAIPLLPASGGPAVAPTLHEQWHLDHPGYPCEYAEDAAADRDAAVNLLPVCHPGPDTNPPQPTVVVDLPDTQEATK